MYVLDTDVLSLVQAGHARVGERRGRVDPADIAITVITRIEVLRARFDHLLKAASGEELLRAQQWLIRSEELLSQLALLANEIGKRDHYCRRRPNALTFVVTHGLFQFGARRFEKPDLHG